MEEGELRRECVGSWVSDMIFLCFGGGRGEREGG